MALKIWLPLTQDSRNQGTSNLTFSNLGTSNTIIDNNGKLGKCFKNNSVTTGGFLSNTTINLGQNQSMFCWINFTNLTANSSLGCGMVTQHRYQANTGMGLTIKYVSSTTGYLSVNTGNGSSRTYNTYCATTLMQANTWYHVGYTYNGSVLKLYVNGICENTVNITGMSVPADYIAIYSWSFTGTSGSTVHGNYRLNGSLNDVRIYDHCLSQVEVKEISRGLVCHYKLDGVLGGLNENLLKLVPKAYSPAAYNAYQLNLTENLVAGQTYTLQLWNVNVSHTGKTASNLGLSVYWGGGSVGLLTLNGTSYFTNGHADYIKASFTVTSSQASGSGATNLWLNIYNSVPNADGTRNMSIGKWKLEKGSNATNYCKTVAEMGIDNSKVTDCSGHGYHGTITGTLTTDSSTPRYNLCYYFDNGLNNKITAPVQLSNDYITMNIWIKSKNGAAGTGNYHMPFEINGSYYEMSIDSNGKFRSGFIIGGTRVANTTPNPNIISDKQWHMITATYDGVNIKRYVDGELVQTQAASGTLAGGALTVYIGGTYGTTTSYATKELYESDARIYATALSADDIKELYQVSAKIDKNGNFHTFEGIEDQSVIKINKQGQIKVLEINENNKISFDKTGDLNTYEYIEV